MTATIVGSDEKDLSKFAFALQQMANGRSNAVGSVTLRASQTTTVVTNTSCGAGSSVFIMPITANASAVFKDCYISSVGAGTFTITHPSNSNTDKSFFYANFG